MSAQGSARSTPARGSDERHLPLGCGRTMPLLTAARSGAGSLHECVVFAFPLSRLLQAPLGGLDIHTFPRALIGTAAR
eukprot:1710117-Prymnesium_polylepis.1